MSFLDLSSSPGEQVYSINKLIHLIKYAGTHSVRENTIDSWHNSSLKDLIASVTARYFL